MTFSISCSPQQLPCIVVKPDNLTPANYWTQGGLEINLQSSLCDALRLPSDAPDTMLDSESPRDRAPLPAARSTAAAAVGLGDALLCCDDNECSDRESASSALNTPHTHNRLHPRCCCCPLLVHSQHFHHLQCFDTVGWAYKTAACMKLIANQCTAYVCMESYAVQALCPCSYMTRIVLLPAWQVHCHFFQHHLVSFLAIPLPPQKTFGICPFCMPILSLNFSNRKGIRKLKQQCWSTSFTISPSLL